MDADNIPGCVAVHYDVSLDEARETFASWGFVGITNLRKASEPMNCNDARTAAKQGADAGNAAGYTWKGAWEWAYLSHVCVLYYFDYTGYTGALAKGGDPKWIGG